MKAVRFLSFALVAIACDDGAGPGDAAMDAARDASRPDSGTDSGEPPVCDPLCPVDQMCCGLPGGGAECAALRNDPEHCGLCTVNCFDTHRGDGCSANQCTCGSLALGC